jgi:transcriptional regulator with XRE-family HTH domain
MSLQLVPQGVPDLGELIRLERHAFAAKLRVARAVLGWSQSEFAVRVGLTQRAVHKLEQGDTEPRRMTVHAIAAIWQEEGLAFEDNGDGGFRVTVRPALLAPNTTQTRRPRTARSHLGVTGRGNPSAAFRG